MPWSVELAPELDGYTVEWAEPGRYLLSRRNRLFRADDLRCKPDLVGVVPAPFWQRAIARTRLGQRLARFMFYNAIPLADVRVFVTFNRDLGIVDESGFKNIAGLHRPFRVLRGACAVNPRGAVFFGEYLYNETRESIRIYRWEPDRLEAETVHTFAA